jgi:hypothetical protein
MPDLPDPPRLLSEQLLYLLVAEVRRKSDPGTPFLDCFTCGLSSTGATSVVWPGGEEERLLTVQPCGHRFTYSAKVADLVRARAEALAAAPAGEPAGREATEAIGEARWEDAQAVARAAVASTLEESNCWLPDAVQRRIANAVVYAVAGRLPVNATRERV